MFHYFMMVSTRETKRVYFHLLLLSKLNKIQKYKFEFLNDKHVTKAECIITEFRTLIIK